MGQYYYYGPQQEMYGQFANHAPNQQQKVQVSNNQSHESVSEVSNSDSVPLVANKYAMPGDDVPGGLRKV